MQPSQHGAAAGIAAPEAQTDERPGGQAGALQEQAKADAADFAQRQLPEQLRAAEKQFSTLQAAAMLRNITVQRIDGDAGVEYVVSQRGGAYVARRFSLDALGGLLQRMGVRQP